MQTSRLPTPVAWLGYGGLLPFLGFAAMSMVEPTHGIIYRVHYRTCRHSEFCWCVALGLR
jgi:hypothetical protein